MTSHSQHLRSLTNTGVSDAKRAMTLEAIYRTPTSTLSSRCGLTYQYKGLQALYDKYKNKNFIIIGFPANNFLFQEPGTNQQISEFCKKNYGVTFPIMSKIDVKGKNIHPIYSFLTDKSKNGYIDSKVTWNFQKYLIND